MRELISSVLLLLTLVSCGGTADQPRPELTKTSIPTETGEDEPSAAVQPVDPRPVWEGFATGSATPQTLAAYAREPLQIYETRQSPEPLMTIEQTTILGTVTVLGVVADPQDGWVEVMLPVRPNGSTGWVKADQLSLYVVDGEIVVDLSERRLTYLVDDVEILATEVGIGSKYNQTPTGHYFVTDNVTLANPNSPWGPHALGLSARSETVTEFNGGDGIIGIHGTNNASSIGGNISLGCVRLPNEMITILHELVPLGTRVTVTA
jgi:hypothetical protein